MCCAPHTCIIADMECGVLTLEARKGTLEVGQLVRAAWGDADAHDWVGHADGCHGQVGTAICKGVATRTLHAKQRDNVTSSLSATT
jgi:hypothetical protein